MTRPVPSRTGRPAPRAVAAQAVLVVLAIAAGLAVAPAFGGRLTSASFAPAALVVAVVAGALLPAAAVTVARWRGLDATAAAGSGLLVLVVGVGVVTRPGTAVFSGAYRLLTSALPADADGPACATVGVVVGLCSLAAALLAGYGRARAAAVLPAFVALLAALALDAGLRQPPAWYVIVLLVLLGAALALLRVPAPRPAGTVPARIRTLYPVVGAAVILAVAAGGASALLDELPAVSDHAADARDLVEAPLRPRDAVNPMLQYPALAQGTQRVRFTGTASRRIDRLTLVTLDEYTGRTWTTTAGYRRAGGTLADTASGPRVDLDVRVEQPGSLTWLLRPDRPTSLAPSGFGVDESSGDIVVPAGTRYPTRYRVSGESAPAPTRALADRAVAALPERGRESIAEVPRAVRTFAGRARTGRTDLQVLLILQNQLDGPDFYTDDTAEPAAGNGNFQLQRLVAGSGRHLGTSEQYASAFAVMARVLGYDSRLVLGFRPTFAPDGRTFRVTGRDVHAWAQVRFAGVGWVTFDPTPERSASRARPVERPDAGGARPTPTPSSSRPTPPSPSTSSSTAPDVRADSDDRAGSTGAVAATAGLVVVLLLATPPGIKATRRRRRRHASVPAHAVAGAWRETADRLSEVGRAPQRGRTTADVAADAPRPARDDVRDLGRVLDRAGYAPEDAGPDDARTAWQHADAAAARIRSTLPWWRRLLAQLDPRPLWRR